MRGRKVTDDEEMSEETLSIMEEIHGLEQRLRIMAALLDELGKEIREQSKRQQTIRMQYNKIKEQLQ
jgi:hypothetical protein